MGDAVRFDASDSRIRLERLELVVVDPSCESPERRPVDLRRNDSVVVGDRARPLPGLPAEC